MSLSDFEVINRLGEGAYSSVYQVRRHADGEIYALKKVKMVQLSDKEKENALNEVRILASIKHQNISSYKEAFIDEPSSSLCIIMEYSDNGDLFQKITNHQKQQQYIQEDEIWKMFIQIVRGLKSLHEAKIFHRDLKSANIFLSKDGTAKLGDMNVSKVAKKGLLYTQTGTPYYASPEVWKDQPYDHKSDIWSLGCVLYESVTLKPPFRAEDMQGLYKKVLRGIYPKIPNIFSSELAQTIKFMVQVAPQMRPSCEKILEMPIVKKKSEKLFSDDFFYDDQPQMNLLSTIRVPKNLLYLTDRLPKPMYDSEEKDRREKEELLRRRTYDDNGGTQAFEKDGGSMDQRAPGKNDKKAEKKKMKKAVTRGQSYESGVGVQGGNGPVINHQDQKELEVKEKQNSGAVRKSRKTDETEEVRQSKNSKNGDTRKSQQQEGRKKSQAESSMAANKPGAAVRNSQNSKISTKKTQDQLKTSKQSSIPKVSTPASIVRHNYDPDEYAEDGFDDDEMDKDDQEPVQPKKDTSEKKRAPPPTYHSKGKGKDYSSYEGSPNKAAHHGAKQKPLKNAGSKEQLAYSQVDQGYDMNQQQQQQLQLRENPSNSNLHASQKQKKPPMHGQQGHYKQRKMEQMYGGQDGSMLPQVGSNSELSGQIYQKGQRHILPHQQNVHGHPSQGMAYVNISSDGAKPVGPIGLKRAEKELIMRRYNSKYQHNNDQINRVALIYGQQTPQYNSHDRNYMHPSQQDSHHGSIQYNQRQQYISPNAGGQLNNGAYQSPYLVNENRNNPVNIVRRSKNYLDDLKNQNSGYQVRLPRLTNMNKANQDYYMNQVRRNQNNGMLPPLVAGQSISNNPNQGQYNPGHQNGNYQKNAYRPSKLRSIHNKGQHLGPQGLSGERLRLNHHGSQEKLSNYSGNYGSPHNDQRIPPDPMYSAQQNQQYIDQVQHQMNQKKPTGSRIGQGVLNKKGNRLPSGQDAILRSSGAGSQISPKKINQKQINLHNQRQLNNNSNVSTNENSQPPKGHQVITANEN